MKPMKGKRGARRRVISRGEETQIDGHRIIVDARALRPSAIAAGLLPSRRCLRTDVGTTSQV